MPPRVTQFCDAGLASCGAGCPWADAPAQPMANPRLTKKMAARCTRLLSVMRFLTSTGAPLSLNLLERLFHDRRRHEARRERTRRKLLEGLHELADLFHRAIDLTDMVEVPVPVSVGRDVGPLERVLEQIVDLLQPELGEGFGPDLHRAGRALLGIDIFVVALAQGHEQPVVVG